MNFFHAITFQNVHKQQWEGRVSLVQINNAGPFHVARPDYPGLAIVAKLYQLHVSALCNRKAPYCTQWRTDIEYFSR